MARDSRYDVLFEPVRIGPVTAPNRFYQVPHCTGMGFQRPQTVAAMRETKAEGGWGVVCTEYCSIHPSSDDSPLPSASLWDEGDIRSHARMVENVHRHGALAGVELWHGGGSTANLYSREEPLGPASIPCWMNHPVQCRAMDKRDIRDVRRWQVAAAKRAKTAGFDIVYVYATHGYLLAEFLRPSNQRGDEYGGSLTNRARFLREMIEDTLDAVGDTCAVAVRFSADAGAFDEGPQNEENRAVVEMLAELPDLWDINARNYDIEIGSSRFVKEGALEDYVRWVKQVTSKPVVSTGRFTAPDAMVRQVREGVLDLIGAARPSIAARSRRRSCGKAGSRTSASASAATSAPPRIGSGCRSAARRTRPWARSGAAAGTRSGSSRAPRSARCSSWAAGRPAWRRRGRSANAATR